MGLVADKMSQIKHLALKAAAAGLAAVAGGALASAGAEPALHPDTPMEAGKAVAGVDPGKCLGIAGRPDIMVKSGPLRSSEGRVRISLYGDNPDTFLESGQKILRIEVPADEQGVAVCLSAPREGDYALALLHDVNGNGKVNITKDGGGFSNNPRFTFSAPSYGDSAFHAPASGVSLDVEIKYFVEPSKPGRQFRRR